MDVSKSSTPNPGWLKHVETQYKHRGMFTTYQLVSRPDFVAMSRCQEPVDLTEDDPEGHGSHQLDQLFFLPSKENNRKMKTIGKP